MDHNKNAVVGERFKVMGDNVALDENWLIETTSVEAISEMQDVMFVLSQVSFSGGLDLWRWDLDSNGSFSVAAVKEWLRKDRYVQPVQLMRWEAWVPLKVNILTWRIELDRVPTRLALVRSNVSIADIRCPLCDTEEESIKHLFVDCGFVFKVWSKVWSWCKISIFYV